MIINYFFIFIHSNNTLTIQRASRSLNGLTLTATFTDAILISKLKKKTNCVYDSKYSLIKPMSNYLHAYLRFSEISDSFSPKIISELTDQDVALCNKKCYIIIEY